MSDNNREPSSLGMPIASETWDHTSQSNDRHDVTQESFGEDFLALREFLIHEKTESPEEESWEEFSGIKQRGRTEKGYPKYLKPKALDDVSEDLD